MKNSYHRLDQQALALLDASNDERIRYIQCDRFVPNSASDTVLALLRDFVDRPPSVRPPCLALIGDSASGKTTLLDQFQLQELTREKKHGGRVVFFTTDSHPVVEILQIALLTALGAPPPVSYRSEKQSNDTIKRTISELNVRLVIIDEIQHLLNLPRGLQPATWDWIKWVSTACRVSVACSGIPGAEAIITRERQLHTRFTVMRLPRWVAGAAFGEFLTAYERSLPLKQASGLGALPLQKAILLETRVKQQISGVTGGVKQVIEHAAIRAIETGKEKITKELIPAWRDFYAAAA